jgi:chromosomal replication initiation ATPase DnaA
LGNGDFVESVLKSSEERMKKKYYLQSKGIGLSSVADRVAEVLGVEQDKIWAAGRHREIVQARSLLCYWAVRELGVTMVSLAVRLDQSVTAVAKAVIRGEKLAKENDYLFLGQ